MGSKATSSKLDPITLEIIDVNEVIWKWIFRTIVYKRYFTIDIKEVDKSNRIVELEQIK